MGKFVTNRQYKVKQLQEPEILKSVRLIPSLKKDAETAKQLIMQDDIDSKFLPENKAQNSNNTSLVTESEYLGSTNDTSSGIASDEKLIHYNLALWQKMVRCRRMTSLNFDLNMSSFMVQLLDVESERLQNCIKDIQLVLLEINKTNVTT